MIVSASDQSAAASLMQDISDWHPRQLVSTSWQQARTYLQASANTFHQHASANMSWFCREAQAALIHDVQAQLHRGTLSGLTDPCAGCWPPKQAEHFASLALRYAVPYSATYNTGDLGVILHSMHYTVYVNAGDAF